MMHSTTPSQLLQRLNTVYYAFLSAMLMAMLLAYISIKDSTPANAELIPIFNYVVPFVCVLNSGMALYLFGILMKKAEALPTLKQKMELYTQNKIIQWAMLEGAVLLSMVALFLTAFQIYVLWALAALILMSLLRPSAENFKRATPLSREAQAQLDQDQF